MVLKLQLPVVILGLFFLTISTVSADHSFSFPHGMPFPATRLLPATEETAKAVSLQKEVVLMELLESSYYHQNTHYTIQCNKKLQKYQFSILFFARNEKELYPEDVVIKMNGTIVSPMIVTQESPSPYDANGEYIGYMAVSQYYSYYTDMSFEGMPDSETGLITIEVAYSDVKEDVTNLIRYGEPSVNEKSLPLVQWKSDPFFSLEIHNRKNVGVKKDSWIINIRFLLKDTAGMDENRIRELENTQWLFAGKNVLNNDLFEITKTEENGLNFTFTSKFVESYQQCFQITTGTQSDQRGGDENFNRFQIVPDTAVSVSKKYTTPYLVKLNLRTEYPYTCYSDHKLNPYELILYTPRELRYVRNAFYAAHGYQFKAKDLQDFFEYTGHAPANPKYTENDFSDIEKYNIEMLKQMEAFYSK